MLKLECSVGDRGEASKGLVVVAVGLCGRAAECPRPQPDVPTAPLARHAHSPRAPIHAPPTSRLLGFPWHAVDSVTLCQARFRATVTLAALYGPRTPLSAPT